MMHFSTWRTSGTRCTQTGSIQRSTQPETTVVRRGTKRGNLPALIDVVQRGENGGDCKKVRQECILNISTYNYDKGMIVDLSSGQWLEDQAPGAGRMSLI